MNMGVAETALELGLRQAVFGIDIPTGMTLLGGVRRLPAFNHDAMGGFQSLQGQIEIALAKAREQAVEPLGQSGL